MVFAVRTLYSRANKAVGIGKRDGFASSPRVRLTQASDILDASFALHGVTATEPALTNGVATDTARAPVHLAIGV